MSVLPLHSSLAYMKPLGAPLLVRARVMTGRLWGKWQGITGYDWGWQAMTGDDRCWQVTIADDRCWEVLTTGITTSLCFVFFEGLFWLPSGGRPSRPRHILVVNCWLWSNYFCMKKLVLCIKTINVKKTITPKHVPIASNLNEVRS